MLTNGKLMQQQENVAATGLGTAIGLIYSWLAFTPSIPAWIGTIGVTILGAALTLITNRLVQIALDRWLPRRVRKPGDTGE